jgi:endonuclease-3
VVVDTHVQRLTRLLGLTSQRDPVKIERDLMALTPQADWIDLSHLLIHHGRAVCVARRPRCAVCVLSGLCPSAALPAAGPDAGVPTGPPMPTEPASRAGPPRPTDPVLTTDPVG